MTTTAAVRDSLQEMAGTWRGSGTGRYPTIDDFGYLEELVIAPVPGKPVAHWSSRTGDPATGEPRHAESGFLRLVDARWELIVAHSFGITEIATGEAADAGRLDLDSSELRGAPGAKSVDAVRRRYRWDGDLLRYRISMAAVGVSMTHHLDAELHRQG